MADLRRSIERVCNINTSKEIVDAVLPKLLAQYEPERSPERDISRRLLLDAISSGKLANLLSKHEFFGKQYRKVVANG